MYGTGEETHLPVFMRQRHIKDLPLQLFLGRQDNPVPRMGVSSANELEAFLKNVPPDPLLLCLWRPTLLRRQLRAAKFLDPWVTATDSAV